MQIGAKQQKIYELRTGAHVKKGIFGFTTGLNRLLDFSPQNYKILFVRGGGVHDNFIYICGMSVSVESSLFVGGGSISMDLVNT